MVGAAQTSHGQESSDGLVVVARRQHGRPPGARTPWRRVLVGVVVAAVLGGGLVAAAGTLVSQRVAEALAVRGAIHDTATIARSVAEPALRDPMADGRATDRERLAARDRLAAAVRSATTGTGIVRVKLWAADGTILWSDEPRLVGERFALGSDDLEALRSDRSDADVSDLDEPENRFERGSGPLLEAYQAVHLPSGQPLLFEVYYRYDTVLAGAEQLRSSFAGLAFGTVGVVLALLVPLLLWLLVRIRDGQRERERLLVRALEAQADERRRIAAELHDGAVQDVAGLALSLGAAARSADGRGGALLGDASDALRGAVSSMRSSLSAIQPAAPDREGLAAAVDDAAARARSAGVTVDIDVPARVDASAGSLRAVMRFVREALANAVRHAGARVVRISVAPVGGDLVVTVSDDGIGFDPDQVFRARRHGHLGTTLLRGVAEDTGGSLVLRTAPGRGTSWELVLAAHAEVVW